MIDRPEVEVSCDDVDRARAAGDALAGSDERPDAAGAGARVCAAGSSGSDAAGADAVGVWAGADAASARVCVSAAAVRVSAAVRVWAAAGYPPPSPEDRLEWLEKRHGSRYPGNNGKGALVGGGLTLGFGALMGLSALTCMVTAAALIDAGDEGAGAITGVAIGTGIATVVLVGTGIPLVIVGKKKRREYRAWLEQQPMSRVRLGFAGGLVLRF